MNANEHEKMPDTPQSQNAETKPAPAMGPGPAGAANQNAPQDTTLSQEALMQAATARIAELEAEVAELKDRWVRSEAEIANVRARSRREVDETRQYAVQKFATDVVEAAENLRRGLDSLPPPSAGQPEILAKLREGLEGVERNFVSIMERNGIKREDPTGQPFDPRLHQAMAEQETDARPPGTILQAWTQAWTLNGRLLRPAMVVVAKAPAPELSAPSAADTKLDTTA
jgi:molecular chaperone GrpE